jgi:hypothetical protein
MHRLNVSGAALTEKDRSRSSTAQHLDAAGRFLQLSFPKASGIKQQPTAEVLKAQQEKELTLFHFRFEKETTCFCFLCFLYTQGKTKN